MEPFKAKDSKKNGPEAIIQRQIIDFLKIRDWFVVVTFGSEYQSGLPDLFICHSRYGQRWVEVKNPKKFRFTPAQMDVFPKLCSNGSGVWILVEATETEYQKLFQPCNWYNFLSVLR